MVLKIITVLTIPKTTRTEHCGTVYGIDVEIFINLAVHFQLGEFPGYNSTRPIEHFLLK